MRKLIIITLMLAVVVFSAFSFSGEKENNAYLGVYIKKLSEKQLKNMDLDYGVQITKVMEKSPADKAGLEVDDIILRVDGKKVESPAGLVKLIKDYKVDDEIKVDYYSAGKNKDVKVKLQERKYEDKLKMLKKIHEPHMFMMQDKGPYLGVVTSKLTMQLRDYFNAPEKMGVLVEEVMKDSPAEKAGIKAGDVIIRFAEKEINNTADLKHGVNYFEPGDEVQVLLIREKKEKTIEVELEEHAGLHMDRFLWKDKEGKEIIIEGKPGMDAKRYKLFKKEIDEAELEEKLKNLEMEYPDVDIKEFKDGETKKIEVKIKEKQKLI